MQSNSNVEFQIQGLALRTYTDLVVHAAIQPSIATGLFSCESYLLAELVIDYYLQVIFLES